MLLSSTALRRLLSVIRFIYSILESYLFAKVLNNYKAVIKNFKFSKILGINYCIKLCFKFIKEYLL